MLSTQVLPAALRYQSELAGIVTASHAVSINCSRTTGRLNDISNYTEDLQKSLEALCQAVDKEHTSALAKAIFIRDVLLPEMLQSRNISDKLEAMIPDDIWPLPSYTEMLFIR